MKILRSLLRTAVSYGLLSTMALAAPAPAVKPTYVLVSAPLFVDTKTTIPGHTLAAGTYSIRIVDHLKDRFILRVDDADGKTLATFIGVHNPELAPFVSLHHQGTILWSSAPKGSAAVRGFSFPNGNTLEFVYPKAQAVALAKLNAYSVPAIDPESEGRKPDPKLTAEDREVVTLWMLTETRVGPKSVTPAIEAKRFVAPVENAETAAPAPAAPAPVLMAKNEAPAALARVPQPAPARVSTVNTKRVAARLPQTASYLPLLALASLIMAGLGSWMSVVRRKA